MTIDGVLPPDFQPPDPDQLEINVFGPGVGESVLVHLGDGRWLVVDSCVARGRAKPAALEYLHELGFSGTAITTIVATHWHDDHVRGLAQTYEEATSADFYAASSINPDEFRAMTGSEPMASRFTSGVEELSRVSLIAESRGVPLRTVVAGQRITYEPTGVVSEVWALSPSPQEVDVSRRHLSALLPTFRPSSRRIPAQPPNDTSIVLQLETVAGSILLGADLEHRADRLRGWHAVMDLKSAPQTLCSLLKVPHHGSGNAHCPEVWSGRLETEPMALLTPFDRGSVSLPRPEDRDRIRGLTPHGYLTSDKRDPGTTRDRTTLKTIKEAARTFKPQLLRLGHLQVRSVAGGWSLAASDEAVAV